jgi:hypothetical protein
VAAITPAFGRGVVFPRVLNSGEKFKGSYGLVKKPPLHRNLALDYRSK